MHLIEPYYHWRDLYIAAEDEDSPFYGKSYSEFEFTNKIYNYLIHPQWDDFGSPTLFIKVLHVDYELGHAVCELIGEWNDCLQEDIMTLKNNIIDHFQSNGVSKFIFICENVLNFHSGDDDYYIELEEEIRDNGGYVILVNMPDHVYREFNDAGIGNYVNIGFPFQEFNWRKFKPDQLYTVTDQYLLSPYLTS